jgi:small-conductance mechanosensitive channel
VQSGLLIVFLALAAGMRALDAAGVTLGRFSDQHTVSDFLGMVFLAAAAYELASLAIQVAIRLRRGPAGEVKMLTSFARVVAVLAMVILFIYYTGRLKDLGAALGAFAGLLLGWSLQAPVSGVAAWALITLKRPFRVGDRVQFPSLGLNGDILEIGLMYTKLDQVGGAVGGEEAIGRDILIPNAMLFSQVVINYTPKQSAPYFLDEVVIRLTYDSDWAAAEDILLRAAHEVTAPIIRETGKEPFVRSDIYDYGVYLRLRYMTLATDRPHVSHAIVKRVFQEFQKNPRVDFAIPFVYSYRKGVESGPRAGPPGETIAEIAMDLIEDPEADRALSPDDLRGVQELAERIAKVGLLQPVIVRPGVAGRYELLAGRFRVLACKMLGWKAISAAIKERPTFGGPDGQGKGI